MTIDELQALPDGELNALAAKLRGWKLLESDHESWRGVTGNYYFESEDGEAECSEGDWTPTTDRNQSGELLAYAASQGASTEIFFAGRTQRSGFVKISGVAIKPFPIKVEGNDARAETIAFCAAMLAIQGETNGHI